MDSLLPGGIMVLTSRAGRLRLIGEGGIIAVGLADELSGSERLVSLGAV